MTSSDPLDPLDPRPDEHNRAPDQGRPGADGAPADDVDRLFARLEPLPAPRDFVPQVLRASRQAPPAPEAAPAELDGGRQWRWLWAAAGAGALLALLGLAFFAGQALAGGAALDLLVISLGADGAAPDVRRVAVLGLADAFPWLEALGLALTLAFLTTCARRLSPPPAERPPGPAAGRPAGAT